MIRFWRYGCSIVGRNWFYAFTPFRWSLLNGTLVKWDERGDKDVGFFRNLGPFFYEYDSCPGP